MAIVSIDPVTRIEGHLRMDVEVQGGVVTDAWSSGTMFRGYEMLIKGKHPWDAQQVMERICGVCPLVHGTAASYALDDALKVALPDNARLIRNLTLGANFIQSHVLHFYHLAALDYIDITKVLEYSGVDKGLQLVKTQISQLAAANDLYPFMPRYESTDYIEDPDVVTTLVNHYIQALEMRKKAQEMLTIFYGRMPSFVGTIPGGVTQPPTLSNILAFAARLEEIQTWIDEVYVPDVVFIAKLPQYQPFITAGASGGNYLAYGGFDQNQAGTNKFLPRGTIISDAPGSFDETKIVEFVKHSWYTQDCGNLNPKVGKTQPQLDKTDAYSFLKAPRYNNNPMEVGPMARMLVLATSSDPNVAPQKQQLVDTINGAGLGALLTLNPSQWGIIPRHGARALECQLVANAMSTWLGQLKAGQPIWDPKAKNLPSDSFGRGLVEGPRGALGHWIHIQNQKVGNYQAVVPTTWNASPRDNSEVKGPIEASLKGIPVPDTNNPINVVRTIRSFDPCIACAVHIIDPENETVKEFRVV